MFYSFILLASNIDSFKISFPSNIQSKLVKISTNLIVLIGLTSSISSNVLADDQAVLLSESKPLNDAKIVNANTISPQEAKEFVTKLENTRELNSDEMIIQFNNDDLGLAISETSYNGYPVCTITKIIDKSLKINHPELRIGAILTKINDQKVDGIPLRDIAKLIKTSTNRPLNIKFRDPSRYFELLDSMIGKPLRVITSSYLPANTRYTNLLYYAAIILPFIPHITITITNRI